jgi:hypothetical protein
LVCLAEFELEHLLPKQEANSGRHEITLIINDFFSLWSELLRRETDFDFFSLTIIIATA